MKLLHQFEMKCFRRFLKGHTLSIFKQNWSIYKEIEVEIIENLTSGWKFRSYSSC